MSFEWQHFLDLAEQLARKAAEDNAPTAEDASAPPAPIAPRSSSEAALRTAISRAYYATYHIAVEYIDLTGGGLPPKINSHQWAWDQFNPKIKPSVRKQERRIFNIGRDMLFARKAADYEFSYPSLGISFPKAMNKWDELADYSIINARTTQQLFKDIWPNKS